MTTAPANFGLAVPGALATGIDALGASLGRLDQDAARVAQAGAAQMSDTSGGNDLTGALVDTGQASLAAQAAIAVIRTSNTVLGALLDVRA